MKLIYRTITTLGIATLIGVQTHAVRAMPAPKGTTTLISQIDSNGFSHSGGGGIIRGSFYYPGGGSFYRGNLNSQGNGLYQGSFYNPSRGSIYQGTFYNPTNGGNFHGLFYNPRSGRVYEGNFYNPGPSTINQGSFYNPDASSINQGTFYNPGPSTINQGNSYSPVIGGQRDYKRAIEYYSQAIRRNPRLVDAYNKRALARFVLGDKQGTIEDLKKAASLYSVQGDQSRYQETLETIRDIR